MSYIALLIIHFILLLRADYDFKGLGFVSLPLRHYLPQTAVKTNFLLLIRILRTNLRTDILFANVVTFNYFLRRFNYQQFTHYRGVAYSPLNSLGGVLSF